MVLRYRADIDGLRALAVLAVILFHTFPNELPGGFVGVDIFFVISGYLITQIILEELVSGNFTAAAPHTTNLSRPDHCACRYICVRLALLPADGTPVAREEYSGKRAVFCKPDVAVGG